MGAGPRPEGAGAAVAADVAGLAVEATPAADRAAVAVVVAGVADDDDVVLTSSSCCADHSAVDTTTTTALSKMIRRASTASVCRDWA